MARFHGHSEEWESRDIYDRFGYRYREQELAQWSPKVAQLAEKASEVHVLMNNLLQRLRPGQRPPARRSPPSRRPSGPVATPAGPPLEDILIRPPALR